RDSGEFCGEPGGQRFYFDLRTKKCQPFYYKGCGGNQNRFDTKANCMMMCSNSKGSTATAINAVCKSGAYAAGATSLPEPLPCSECPKGYKCEDGICCPTKDYLCDLPYDAGRFGDQGSHRPRQVLFNSFFGSEHKTKTCAEGKGMLLGKTYKVAFIRYFFTRSYNNCMLFTYYGRDGNANNFETYNECKAMCMS
ncbi:unnamed protein product, partial [Angiostrongylus costaricensis]|uniref:Kunitz/Bovine pancreatic trypsin inhibitor domain protein n=1 Tax=Angiostrongylus costaricensis TaxID=334426 RepID=A0A0R3PMX9_ANGCS